MILTTETLLNARILNFDLWIGAIHLFSIHFIFPIINNFVRVCGYGQFQVELFKPSERLLTPAPKLKSTKYQQALKLKTSQHGCKGIRYIYSDSDKEFCVLASLTKPEECFKKKGKQSKSNEVEVHHSIRVQLAFLISYVLFCCV